MKYKASLKQALTITILLFLAFSMFARNVESKNQGNDVEFQTSGENLFVRSHQTEVDVFNVDTITVTETFVVQNLNTSTYTSIDIWLNTSLKTIIVEDVEGMLVFDWNPVSNQSHLLSVDFRTPIDQNDTATFSIGYELDVELLLTEGDPNFYSFEFYSTISHFTRTYTMSMVLPELSFIHDVEGISPFYPANATQILLKNRIVVSWIFTNISKSNNPFFLLRFDEPIIPETDVPFFKKTFNIFWIGIIVGIFLGISGTSWLIRYREKQAMKKLGRTLLTDTQKALIRIVYDHKGKISQRELCDITGYSKSKISRNLVPLEMRGLIRREKWGRTYVVYLTDDGRTVIE